MWTVDEDGFDAGALHHGETVFTIGNGYLSTRGALEEAFPGEWRTTFLHGVFDAVPLGVTEIANVPDWTAVQVLLDGEEFRMDWGVVEDHRRSLDLRTGELTRSLRWTSPGGRAARLEFRRFASLADEHLAIVTVRVTPEADCQVEVRVPVSAVAANVNDGRFVIQHTVPLATLPASLPAADDGTGDIHGVHIRTVDGRYEVALAARVTPVGGPPSSDTRCDAPGLAQRTVRFDARSGDVVGLDKVVAYQTSRDGEADLAAAVVRRARAAAVVEDLAAANAARWAEEWEACDVEIDGDPDAQLAVRFNIFQLLVAAPRHDDQVSIGAKTLSGFGYRGHAFWDTEIFMLPLFSHALPGVARNLLDYRWHRLPQARAKAAGNGCEGAQFPWESADTGEEVTPTWVPSFTGGDRLDRVWTGDIEIHISADIAHAAMRYWQVTGDDAWFAARGAELVLDTARYYASRAEEDPDRTFHYRDVIGPDEYHEHVDDNAYTNAMARWNIRAALGVLEWLRERGAARASALVDALDLTAARLARWEAVADGIAVPSRPDGVVPQFEGYLDLIDVDVPALEPRTRSLHAVFGIEGANARQALKQPDVLMMMLLLEDEFTDEQRRINYAYYTPRTDHTYGSSLGPAMQAIIAARAGLADDAVEHFRRAAFGDLHDVRGNANDGIHGASCGGVWQAVAFGFAGLRIAPDGTWTTSPALPAGWDRVAFNITVRGRHHRVEVTR